MAKALRGTVWLVLLGTCFGLKADQPTAEQIDLFERKIRPIFSEHCYACHSEKAEKLKGGLRLDTPEGLLKGGNSGVVIAPGDPDSSSLIKAVRYEDAELQMPPKGKKLSAEQISLLETWVKAGAPVPATVTGQNPAERLGKARAEHWAFQPVNKPKIPQAKNQRWIATPVDSFVLAKLEEKHLSPAPRADRRTLIRRVSYNLLGLPPSPKAVESFVNDNRPDAYAALVDKLLASPHYGERWGRHWLDVARYADTKGYLAGGEERRFAFSYTYRDYVIRALNEDMPYDQFLVEQIAADRLPSGNDHSSLAALGFLTLGRRFLNNQDDIIDDRIDVVTRGTLGLTVACARCHDHKFDPIPTADYYALHGVFASSEEPAERPLLGELRDSSDYQDFLKQKEKIEQEIREFEKKEIAEFLSGLKHNVGDYLLGARDAASLDGSKIDNFAGERKLLPALLRRWMTNLDSRAKSPDPIFSPWFELSQVPNNDFSNATERLYRKLSAEPANVNTVLKEKLTQSQLGSPQQLAEVYSKLFKEIDQEWKNATTNAAQKHQDIRKGLPDPRREALRQVLYAEGAPPNLPESEVRVIHARRLHEGAAPMRNKIEALSWTHPGAPPRAMALIDRPDPHNSHIARRGNPANPGPEVQRHFLQVLSIPGILPFTNGSGRLELARAIASPSNPLTARVYVNRVWLHHFGDALVNTPGDFGIRTESPPQRELLDYLAAFFMENGWSTKKLHRLILLSSTYQQSSEADSEALRVDPDNRLIHHVNRRRLDFEELRDSLLASSGKLDQSIGGLPVDLLSEPYTARRAVYGLIDRQNLPGLFRTFDFANPDTSNQRRFATTVPQQALFMLNSPFVLEQSRSLAQRDEVRQALNCQDKIQAMYRLLWQRSPDAAELRDGQQYLAGQGKENGPVSSSALERYAQVLLLSNEFSFID